MTNPLFSGAAAACLVLSACELPQPPAGADILGPGASGKIPTGWVGNHESGAVAPNWIASFRDPELTRLVQRAVARNPDLTAAAARVEASRAAVRVAASELYPQVGLAGLGERSGRKTFNGNSSSSLPDFGSGGNNRDNSSGRWVTGIGIGASWEADVWGRVRSKAAASQADSDALAADYNFARQSLAASVARAYFSAIEASIQARNARESLELYADYEKLTDLRKEQGFSSDFELAQIRSRAAEARDQINVADASRAQSIRAIELIAGSYPSGKLATRPDFPRFPKSVPAGLPSQILERRPDLVAAEYRFVAAFQRVNEARTAKLPRFGLSASNGLGSASLDDIGSLSAVTWRLTGNVFQPIFLGGQLQAAEDIRTAEQKAAAADYASAALGAFGDVEAALSNNYYLRRRKVDLDDMVDNSTEAVRLGNIQLKEGMTDTFVILRLVGESLEAKVARTQVEASLLRERANLFLALGGDFEGTGK